MIRLNVYHLIPISLENIRKPPEVICHIESSIKLVELTNLSAKVYHEVSRYQIVGKSHVHIVASDFFIIFGNKSCKIFCKCSTY